MSSDFFAHVSGKLIVHGMAGTGGDDASFDGLPDKGHVADDIKEFVACRLVLPEQRLGLQVT
jgi:hypothetical protein